ncbi:helix-turn-helix transcriptional regulator [Brevibacillus porteri]|uniref:ArsR family transcriptional regulator n=1 Tax=Brevibacillus porteri TaxID=2126350 RepID=A0ABX5FRB6_9BACL|nr:metalloregulator ArsR/SmtB family transcription factor [Brevibacillus porteri]MED1799686.1 transcriptional regulator [Brevibacillus porteri]MED2133126.1 transcriptional regulator [Brevibacillus porteri]MED2748672.1 transcriptional regulator [Brevibacillus porteri]MED2813821.1 transcriptional regulator [Brevibacillus porteri]MED2893010.1 transcriptional regulator [Brevibacillus porteri]
MTNEGTSTRDQILHMLKVKGSLPVSDMAVDLGITEMAVRRHLNTLERDNLIKSTLVRQAMGRPTNVYSLSQEADELFPRNYSHLTLDFLQDIKEIDGLSKIEMLFRRRENRLEETYRSHMQGDLEKRVAKLAELQNDKGYMVEWEKDENGDGYRIQEFNCPISQVAREFNQACSCELSLFRRVLNANVEQTTCMAKGGDKCVFHIKEAK